MNFYAIGYIVRDPFVKPVMKVVVVPAKSLDLAVGFVRGALCQFYNRYDVFTSRGYAG